MIRLARLHSEDVLQEERHAAERAGGGCRRVGARLVEARVNHRVQRRVQALDARDRVVDELARGDVAFAHELRLRRGVQPCDVGHGR